MLHEMIACLSITQDSNICPTLHLSSFQFYLMYVSGNQLDIDLLEPNYVWLQ